jgi:hypothetical protein
MARSIVSVLAQRRGAGVQEVPKATLSLLSQAREKRGLAVDPSG